MAGEIIRTESAWVTVIGSAATANNTFDAGTRTAISATSLTATEQKQHLLDFNLDITVAGTAPDENGVIQVFRIPAANTTAEPTPNGNFKPHAIATFYLDNVTGANDYYFFSVENVDSGDKFITYNKCGQTITYSLLMRTRTTKVST